MKRALVIYDFATDPFWISLYMREIWFSAVSHKWLCNRSFLNFLIYEKNLIFVRQSYMTLQTIPSEFPYIWEKLDFLPSAIPIPSEFPYIWEKFDFLPSVIYDFATDPFWISFCMRKIFLFLSVRSHLAEFQDLCYTCCRSTAPCFWHWPLPTSAGTGRTDPAGTPDKGASSV